MKITEITAQKRNERLNIFIDNKFAFGISSELAYKYNLKTGKELNEKFIEDILKDEELNKAINQALKFLSYRQRSEKEIRDKLEDKGYEEIYVDEAVSYCKKHKYIDDRTFAESFIRDKINLNNFGSYRIKRELGVKGISDEIISDVLIEDKESEYERAFEIAKKKYSTYKNIDKIKAYRRLSGFLQRKGYSFDIVNSILNKLID